MRIQKTLSFKTLAAVMACSSLSASAGLVFSTSSTKSYRSGSTGLLFNGGSFDVDLQDGNFAYQLPCARFDYWRPNIQNDPCPLGATGYLTASNLINEETNSANYFSVTSIAPAIVVQPERADKVSLIAAPASRLQRPSQGFTDNSFSIFFNISAGSQSNYSIAKYTKSEQYTATERSKFESEIVNGVYQYVFPRLNQPNVISPVKATIFPMAEGIARKNNKISGFDFTGIAKTKLIKPNNVDGLPPGYVELNYWRANTITWQGLTQSEVFANVDRLHFSVRRMTDALNPSTTTLDIIDDGSRFPSAVFPTILSGSDPRITLPSPYTRSYSIPPILRGGTRGMVQVEISRLFNTGGIAFDFSNRKFEMPVIVVNRYTDYALATGITKANILDDTDGDGFNNLTEWTLSSNARFAGSKPSILTAKTNPIEFTTLVTADLGGFFFVQTVVKEKQYYGFQVDQKLQTIPGIQYILERSIDGGQTWNTFVSDSKWNVYPRIYQPGQRPFLDETDTAGREYIRVESRYSETGTYYPTGVPEGINQGPPPGVQNETYRVKITL